MDKYFRYHIPWVVWLAIDLILCLTPGDKLPSISWDLISIGTVAHFSIYFGLSLLMLFGYLSSKKNKDQKKLNLSNLGLYLKVILAGIAIGFFIELIQGNFIYRRYYDPEDIVVNSIGTVFGVIGYTLIGRKLV